ncbi:MAG: hypothetical protein ACE5IR_18160, partial [bacterium]
FFYDVHTQIASVYGVTKRGKTTENILGLNRHDLRTYRSSYVRKLYVLSRIALKNLEATALLDEALKASAEYSAFARALTDKDK